MCWGSEAARHAPTPTPTPYQQLCVVRVRTLPSIPSKNKSQLRDELVCKPDGHPPIPLPPGKRSSPCNTPPIHLSVHNLYLLSLRLLTNRRVILSSDNPPPLCPNPHVTLLTPSSFVGPLISLCESHGGSLITQSFLSADRAMLQYNLPLAEIATDFHDRVKTLSSGYASFDYEPAGTQVGMGCEWGVNRV